MTGSYRCPSCKQDFSEPQDFLPFCSKRCKLLDLGAWAAGAYKIPGPELPKEELQQMQYSEPKKDEEN